MKYVLPLILLFVILFMEMLLIVQTSRVHNLSRQFDELANIMIKQQKQTITLPDSCAEQLMNAGFIEIKVIKGVSPTN